MKQPANDIESELNELLLKILENDLEDAVNFRDAAQEKVNSIQKKLSHVRAKMQPEDLTLEAPERAPSGRLRKGEAERLISEFLKNRNGTGATIKSVMEATEIKYTTVFRTLHSLVRNGQAEQDENTFHWRKS